MTAAQGKPEVFGLSFLTPEMIKALAIKVMSSRWPNAAKGEGTDGSVSASAPSVFQRLATSTKQQVNASERSLSPSGGQSPTTMWDVSSSAQPPWVPQKAHSDGFGEASDIPPLQKKATSNKLQKAQSPPVPVIERLNSWGEEHNKRLLNAREDAMQKEQDQMTKTKMGAKSKKLVPKGYRPIAERAGSICKERDKSRNLAKVLRQQTEAEAATAHPEISSRSKNVQRHLEDWLSWDEKRKLKITQKQVKQMDAEMQGCTFKPQLMTKSSRDTPEASSFRPPFRLVKHASEDTGNHALAESLGSGRVCSFEDFVKETAAVSSTNSEGHVKQLATPNASLNRRRKPQVEAVSFDDFLQSASVPLMFSRKSEVTRPSVCDISDELHFAGVAQVEDTSCKDAQRSTSRSQSPKRPSRRSNDEQVSQEHRKSILSPRPHRRKSLAYPNEEALIDALRSQPLSFAALNFEDHLAEADEPVLPSTALEAIFRPHLTVDFESPRASMPVLLPDAQTVASDAFQQALPATARPTSGDKANHRKVSGIDLTTRRSFKDKL